MSVLTQEDAEMAIRSTDFGLIKLDMIRSNLGSTQNQLTSTIANLSAAKINLISSESSIRDVNSDLLISVLANKPLFGHI